MEFWLILMSERTGIHKKGDKMEKTVDELIFDLKNKLKIDISESHLNVSIVEMIVHEVYLEIKDLSERNLRSKIAERQSKENAQEDDQNDG